MCLIHKLIHDLVSRSLNAGHSAGTMPGWLSVTPSVCSDKFRKTTFGQSAFSSSTPTSDNTQALVFFQHLSLKCRKLIWQYKFTVRDTVPDAVTTSVIYGKWPNKWMAGTETEEGGSRSLTYIEAMTASTVSILCFYFGWQTLTRTVWSHVHFYYSLPEGIMPESKWTKSTASFAKPWDLCMCPLLSKITVHHSHLSASHHVSLTRS